MSENRLCDYCKFTKWANQRCPKSAKVRRNGYWYCGIHDPVRVAERQKARMEKSRIEGERRLLNWEWEKAVQSICAGVSTEELEQLGAGWLRRHLDAMKEGK